MPPLGSCQGPRDTHSFSSRKCWAGTVDTIWFYFYMFHKLLQLTETHLHRVLDHPGLSFAVICLFLLLPLVHVPAIYLLGTKHVAIMEYRGYPLQRGLIPWDSETRREKGLEMGWGNEATKRHAHEWALGWEWWKCAHSSGPRLDFHKKFTF